MGKRRAVGNQRGSLTLELAFILPVLIMLVIGPLFLGIALINKSAIRDAAFIGARSSALTGVDSTEIRQDIYDQLDGNFLAGRDDVHVRISYKDVNGMDYSQEQAANETAVDSPVPTAAGEQIRVELSYSGYALDIPFVSNSIFAMRGISVSRNEVSQP